MPTPSLAKTPANGRGFIYMPAGAEIAIGYLLQLLRHSAGPKGPRSSLNVRKIRVSRARKIAASSGKASYLTP
jgi:hypothetical protein